ncbi:intraflagellar transport-associated protein [Hemiscyllium ocellatum]|uniref:intraflagellar transport-associated protein n=1 Tax=Hemiscyllium ocellatum TaxID=170820 RepID=UPI00296749F1|nr:intraflagellar transport-associated protein [Hemiscyllium ocellatum]
MPAVLGSQIMGEGRTAFDALEKFCSSHEQTYAEFLESFMHLKKEDLKKQKTSPEVGSIADNKYKLTRRVLLENLVQVEGEMPKDDKKVEHYVDVEEKGNEKQTEHQSNTAHWNCQETCQNCQKQMSQGSSKCQEELSSCEKPYPSNFNKNVWSARTGLEVLPGEIVDETAANYSHYESKHTSLNFTVNPNVEKVNVQTYDQVLSDEIQPFTLDEDFDYDHVNLKPKYTEAELKMISTLSKQRLEREDLM